MRRAADPDVPTWTASIDDKGRLHFENRPAFDRYIESLGAGAVVDVTVEPQPLRATDRQRRWWFSQVIAKIAEQEGYDRHERKVLHYQLLEEFGGHYDKDGRRFPRIISWTELSVRDAWDLSEWVVRWAAQFFEGRVQIKFPGELRDALLAEMTPEDRKRATRVEQ